MSGNGKAKPSPSIDFTAGVFAGAAGLVVGQPLDVIKVRYQTATTSGHGQYTSIAGALGSIVRNEGPSGLFKGVWSPMAGIAFINGVVFTTYSLLMKLQNPPDSPLEPTLGQICLAGAGSGVLAATVACPTELIKIRQQSAPTHLNPSTLSVLRGIVRQGGVRGLYRGFGVTAMRDVAYGPYFCTYEAVCRFFKSLKPKPEPSPLAELPARRPSHHHESLIDEAEQERASLTWPELMVAGGVAGVTAWLVTFPLDVLKTRVQSFSDVGGPRPSTWRTATDAVRKEGWRVMFVGLGPTLVRAVPVNMVTFLTFEAIVGGLSQ